MIIVAWSSSGPFAMFYDGDVFISIVSIFITHAILNFLQGTWSCAWNFLLCDVGINSNSANYYYCYYYCSNHLTQLLLAASLDIILTWNALKNMEISQLLRYLLKFVAAAVWFVVLPVSYSSSLQNPSGLIKFVTSWAGDWGNHSLYTYVVVIYLLPNIVAVILFFLPPVRRTLEHSNVRIVTLLMWWIQVKKSGIC